MPFDAGGTFTRSYSWQADRDAGIKILAQRMDGEFNNYAGGLNQTFLRTGIVPMGGPLNMNSNPIVGISNGTLINPGIRFESDTDTGIYSSGPGNISLVADGVQTLSVAPGGVYINGVITLTGMLTTGGITVNGGAQFNGNVSTPASFISQATGTGGIALIPGNTVVSGYVSFNNTTGALVSWIGQANIVTGALNYNANGGHYFTGGISANSGVNVTGRIDATGIVAASAFYADANYFMGVQDGGASALINFDPNDFIRFNRGVNNYQFVINGGVPLTINTTSIQAGDGGSGVIYLGSGSNYIAADPSASTWLFEPNYYWQHNRSSKKLSLVMNTQIAFEVAPTAINANLPVNILGTLQVNGPIATTVPAQGNIVMYAGGASTGYIAFLKPDGVRQGYIGNHAVGGKILYNGEGAGHSFIGGDILTDSKIFPGSDPNFYIQMSSGTPLINFNGGRYLYFDRSTDSLVLYLNGLFPFHVTSTGIYTLGMELGYRDVNFRNVNSPGGNVVTADRGKGVLFLSGADAHGITPCPTGTIVTLVNASGHNIVLVNAGVNIYWAANNVAGNINLAPGALATVVFATSTTDCLIAGAGVFR